jgi:hypothetical protein
MPSQPWHAPRIPIAAFLVMAQHPETRDLVLEHEDLLQLSDAIINAWRKQLGHDEEDQTELEGD